MILNIFFQAIAEKITREHVLKSQNDYKGILKMFLVV